jgi:hypothetical protein
MGIMNRKGDEGVSRWVDDEISKKGRQGPGVWARRFALLCFAFMGAWCWCWRGEEDGDHANRASGRSRCVRGRECECLLACCSVKLRRDDGTGELRKAWFRAGEGEGREGGMTDGGCA